MTAKRAAIWFALLALVLAIRVWDPLSRYNQGQGVSAPVERQIKAVGTSTGQAIAATSNRSTTSWPVRAPTTSPADGNAFLTRSEWAMLQAKRHPPPPPAPPPAYAYGPPRPPAPPPPPVEPPPALQVIGTWGPDSDLAVFLAGPQGTLLAHTGDIVMAQYRVQSISKQQITLLQSSNRRTWNLPIPLAPSTFQTWPPR